jgi:hypothetical protein
MRSVRSLVFAAAFLLVPAMAHASWIDWLERLSGPGPFIGTGPDLNLLCIDENNNVEFCGNPLTASKAREGGKKIKQTAQVTPEIFIKWPGQRFDDTSNDDRSVRILKLSTLYEYRFDNGFSLGAGVGVWRFSGDGFDSFNRFDITPVSANIGLFQNSDKLKPWRMILQLHYIKEGFKATDFDPASTSHYNTNGGEWLASIGVNYDLTRK